MVIVTRADISTARSVGRPGQYGDTNSGAEERRHRRQIIARVITSRKIAIRLGRRRLSRDSRSTRMFRASRSAPL